MDFMQKIDLADGTSRRNGKDFDIQMNFTMDIWQ